MTEGRAFAFYRHISHHEAARPPARHVMAEHEVPVQPSFTPAPPPPPAVATGTIGEYQRYALHMVGAEQFACLLPLWDRESGWSPTAENPSSGAYGIPQALPGEKMASAGADWMTDPYTQIRWGIDYIDAIYGSPCGAWEHEQADGWY